MSFPFGAIVGLAGQAVSGIMSAVNNRRQQRAADSEAARQVASDEANAYRSSLSRSENEQAMRQYDRDSRKQVAQAQAMSAITGASPEFGLGVQKAVAEGRADMMGNMASGASAQKDKYLDRAEQVRQQKSQDDMRRMAERQQSYANMAANAASAVGSIMDSYTAGGKNMMGGMRKAEPTSKGLDIGAAPTTIGQEQAKVDSGLAAIKKQNGWKW